MTPNAERVGLVPQDRNKRMSYTNADRTHNASCLRLCGSFKLNSEKQMMYTHLWQRSENAQPSQLPPQLCLPLFLFLYIKRIATKTARASRRPAMRVPKWEINQCMQMRSFLYFLFKIPYLKPDVKNIYKETKQAALLTACFAGAIYFMTTISFV